MNHDNSPRPIKWAARLPHVRDVTLLGTAAFDYWQRRLQAFELTPVDEGGRTRLMIVGAESRFMGIPFGEVSISLAVQPRETAPDMPLDVEQNRQAAYLLHAFNSVRFFAFCERQLFQTPYQHGGVRVRLEDAHSRASFEVRRRREVVLRAELAAADAPDSRQPACEANADWNAIIHLPPRSPVGASDRFFIAQIRGAAYAYPFAPDRDRLLISPGHDDDVLRALVESDFAAEQWLVRADGQHAKSQTYRHAKARQSV